MKMFGIVPVYGENAEERRSDDAPPPLQKMIHVAITGNDDEQNDGRNAAYPLRTIQAAAERAQPGDTITVQEGVYRECIQPPRGGTSDDQRIVYQAAPGATVVIKGSEEYKQQCWQHVQDNAWSLTVQNNEETFGDYNPYGTLIHGAWYEAMRPYHTGAVYLNGHWLKEAPSKNVVVPSPEGQAADKVARKKLMNIASVHTVGSPWWPASDFVEKSNDIDALFEGGEKFMGTMKEGSYIIYDKDFGNESTRFAFAAASPVSGGIVEFRKDVPDGALLGKASVGFTAEWHHFQVYFVDFQVALSGMNRICLVFSAHPAEGNLKSSEDKTNNMGYWFAEVNDETTTIWADFNGKDPNQELVEINVRKAVFYPEATGMDYITVRGFTLEHAAAPWVSPTAEQVGLIGTNWSKGWIIENNTIRYSVCVGLTLGKHGDEHDHTYDYSGTSIPKGVERGWNNVGYHVVRNNHIYNNGQGGVQGSLGCSFSTIVGNEIHSVKKDHHYGGCETAGIKLHGAVDVLIKDNHVYNCEHWGGIWLDWMAQGARVTGNLLHDNSQDMMLEVNHGPHLIDNNLLLSKQGIIDASGGGAFVQNLCSGNVHIWVNLDGRLTPYFKPHSVDIVESIHVIQNDERVYNNIFAGGNGTAAYDQHDITIASAGNVFLKGARPSKHDRDAIHVESFDHGIQLEKRQDGWWLDLNVDSAWLSDQSRQVVTTELLGKAVRPDAPFVQPDGSAYLINADYFGEARAVVNNPEPGPLRWTDEDKLSIKVWPK